MRINGKMVVFIFGGLAVLFAPEWKQAAAGVAFEKTQAKLLRTLEEALPGPGRPVLLVFFSTSCRVCWDDLFETKAMIEENDFPVKLVGVSLDRPDDLEDFLKKYSFPYSVVSDRRRQVHRRFQVRAAPFKLLLLDETVLYRDDLRQNLKTQRERLRRCLIEMASRSRPF